MKPRSGSEAAITPGGDQPLRGRPHPYDRLHWNLYSAELIGTALLVALGLSVVIALWGEGGPFLFVLSTPWQHRAFSGFLFGLVGLAITLSPLGRLSGAHLNPSVTLAFWLEGKIKWRDASGYVVAQMVGAVGGAWALLGWGKIGSSIAYGSTVPTSSAPLWAAGLGEVAATFSLIVTLFVLSGHPRTRRFTPYSIPPLFSLMVCLESPLSGTSTNLARSFGPAAISGAWQGFWIYLIGPFLGAALAVGVLRIQSAEHRRPREARVAHHRV